MSTCETGTGAFAHHGIDDGTDLVSTTYTKLVTNEYWEPEPTSQFVEAIAAAFRYAYITHADVPLVPEPIDVAIDNASNVISHRLLDDESQDLRTDVVPAFYLHTAQTYCAHLEAGGDPGEVGIWFKPDG